MVETIFVGGVILFTLLVCALFWKINEHKLYLFCFYLCYFSLLAILVYVFLFPDKVLSLFDKW